MKGLEKAELLGVRSRKVTGGRGGGWGVRRRPGSLPEVWGLGSVTKELVRPAA